MAISTDQMDHFFVTNLISALEIKISDLVNGPQKGVIK